MPISVAIVEDDPTVRESLGVLIQGVAGFRLAGAYDTAEKALAALPDARPNVVLMDINLPRMSGVECVGKLKKLLPQVQILMLTVYEDSEVVFRALTQGASGYLVKRTAPDKLLDAIREAHEGGAPMTPQIARKVVQFFHGKGSGAEQFETLSEREREILNLLVKGLLYKEIADVLSISTETVRRHLSNIYSKLHVHTRTEATALYLGGKRVTQ